MPRFGIWIATALLIGMGWLAYAPGLSGGFLFDDYANLPSLGAYGPLDKAESLARYLTSGTADPTGRPLAVASFLLDAQTWPADPAPFKRTNLLLHLFNGGLLAWLLWVLGRERQLPARQAQYAALLGAALWGLHPLFVSTTLYIVQREAMLPATFSLLGMLVYLQGRNQLLAGKPWRGGMTAAVGLGLATLLATLSKANGILLPLLVATLEITVLRAASGTTAPALNRLRMVVLAIPTALLMAYMWQHIPTALDKTPEGRAWTYGQRLLTEPRVLLDYLRLLWLPRPFTSGLFNDQFTISTSLLQPISTLPAMAVVLTLPVMALWLRRKLPLLSAAVLFFFAGHILESSVIPLELYFEHRNYLPALLMFWPLSVWLAAPGSYPAYKATLALTLVLLLAGMTTLRSSLWGNNTEQALVWAQLNPDSPRANAYAAQFEMQLGEPKRAEQRLRQAITRYPNEPQLTFNLLGARCQQGSISEDDLFIATRSLETTRTGTGLLFNWLTEAIGLAKSGACTGLTFQSLEQLIEAAWQNPKIASIAGRRQDLFHLQGRLALAQNEVRQAHVHFDAALTADVRPAIALKQAALLGSSGFPCEGLEHLSLLDALQVQDRPAKLDMAGLHAWLLKKQNYWPQEIRYLRTQLQEDSLALQPPGCPQ